MNKTKKGFTIIEVVLVLAIAGLIFLMVFVALPALQRAQRDTQRKRHVQIVAAALESYKSNNRGQYPWSNKTATVNDRFVAITNAEAQGFFNSYINQEGNIIDPSGGGYAFRLTAYNTKYAPTSGAGGWATGFPLATNFIYVTGGAECDAGDIHHHPATTQISFVIQYRLEIGGVQCQTFN